MKYPHLYDLHQIGHYHERGIPTKWPVYPTKTTIDTTGNAVLRQEDIRGQESLGELVRHLNPDVVFGFGDPQVLQHFCTARSLLKYALVLYVNFDGMPVPKGVYRYLANADRIITMAPFAREVILDSLGREDEAKVSFAYSPADTKRFAPVSLARKHDLRTRWFPDGLPKDSFILGWIGRNQWRKQAWQPYRAIHYVRNGGYLTCERCSRVTPLHWNPITRRFSKSINFDREEASDSSSVRCKHCASDTCIRATPLPKLVLWNHNPYPGGDWPLHEIERQFTLKRGHDVIYTPKQDGTDVLSQETMPEIYSLFDALLYTSGGEGFGLPAWEAMCSGLPVIYTNYSSHADFLRSAQGGIPIDGVLQPEVTTAIWRMIADLGEVIEAILRLYREPSERERLGSNGRAYAERFSVENEINRWHTMFQTLRPARLDRPCALATRITI
jgi:glycosyltransferase involved in cell wall biosynthesis